MITLIEIKMASEWVSAYMYFGMGAEIPTFCETFVADLALVRSLASVAPHVDL